MEKTVKSTVGGFLLMSETLMGFDSDKTHRSCSRKRSFFWDDSTFLWLKKRAMLPPGFDT
ncbi:MAG: hypothetical protein JW778_05010 [Candidatus Altiarchaeota archaeon]|nr:hypothetical protein [Candidatus Altiarchaeota archaeon]